MFSKLESPFTVIKHMYETHQLKIKQDKINRQTYEQKIEEGYQRMIKKQKMNIQRHAEHVARIKSMSEEEKDIMYKQMIKERENAERDYILIHGFRPL